MIMSTKNKPANIYYLLPLKQAREDVEEGDGPPPLKEERRRLLSGDTQSRCAEEAEEGVLFVIEFLFALPRAVSRQRAANFNEHKVSGTSDGVGETLTNISALEFPERES
mmetsp:Transcript_7531/g.11286  ORF Transcript_7531/g.11286 Transcript_7531/m.11286 type:complete len:110 (-) Transcript_7531:1344-1673(-)